MARLTILHYPDSRLRKPALPVEIVDDGVRAGGRHAGDHVRGAGHRFGRDSGQRSETYRGDGCFRGEKSVAGVHQPTLLEREGEGEMEEGCLSVPGFTKPSAAPSGSESARWTATANRSSSTPAGLLAVCIQHEIDHLTASCSWIICRR